MGGGARAPAPSSLWRLCNEYIQYQRLPTVSFRTLPCENEDPCFFFFSDFSLTCGSRYYLLSGFAPCLQARTIFKPIQTLQVLKITLSLLTPSRFGKAFLQTGNPSLSTCPTLVINSPHDLFLLFKLQVNRVIFCVYRGAAVLFSPSIAKGPDFQCGG